MRKWIYLTILLITVPFPGFSQITFYKNYLQEVDDREVFNMTHTSDGGYALIGITATENASDEVGITKLDCTGNVLWARKYGPSSTIGNVFGKVIEADNGDLVFTFAVGTYQSYDIIVARIEAANGDVIWSRRLGGNRDDIGRDLVQTASGDFVLVGGTSSYGSDTSGSPSFTDVYLIRLDGDGNVIWSRTYGSPGQIDAGYALIESPDGGFYVTGRYLVGGTFYALLMKTDADGNPEFVKGYGAPNHRTYGYGITATPDFSEIAITGSTTIDKEDFNSWADPFLIKTDPAGDTIFNRIYYPWVGQDRSESGSSIVWKEDGGFNIAVPTMSFTTHTVGFVPNKNAIYSTDNDGNLVLAKIYNQGGSHYSHISRTEAGEFMLSNFSNFFSPTFEFLPLIIKMDEEISVGCNEIDVTNELSIAIHTWDQQDITVTEGTGTTSNDLNAGNTFGYSNIDTQCEEILEIMADFSVEGMCVGFPLTFTQLSTGSITEYNWDFGDGNMSNDADPVHVYEDAGTYQVELLVTDGCSTDSISLEIVIEPLTITTADTTICSGESILLGGGMQTEAGTYLDTLPPVEDCPILLSTQLTVEPLENIFADTTICEGESVFLGGALQTEEGIYQDTIIQQGSCPQILTTELILKCDCEVAFPNTFTPNGDDLNDYFGANTDCETQLSNFQLKIFNRWGEVVFETNNHLELWDGQCDSENCAADLYFGFASYDLEVDGVMVSKTWQGDLTLIR